MPSIERILIQDAALTYRSVTGAVTRYEIHAARLWNLPGEPERVEAEGSAKGVPFRIFLAADAPAEASGPQLPWSARLEVQCPDLALIASGRVARVFDWGRFDLRIALKGDRPDTIENLFDVDLGGIGAFEITASLAAADGDYRLTELGARIQGRDGGRILAVTDGTASGGRDTPLQIALQGTFGDGPLSATLASERPPAAFFEGAAWPLESRVRMAGAELDLRGAATAAGSRVDLYAVMQGRTSAPWPGSSGANHLRRAAFGPPPMPSSSGAAGSFPIWKARFRISDRGARYSSRRAGVFFARTVPSRPPWRPSSTTSRSPFLFRPVPGPAACPPRAPGRSSSRPPRPEPC